MTAKAIRVCPACRRPARNRPLPPDGFWQEQVLQRIGMYPYRCEACGARFYRKVKVGDKVAPPRRPETHPLPPAQARASGRSQGGAASQRAPDSSQPPAPPGTPRQIPPPRVLTHLDTPSDALTHDDFVDLIDHIKQAEHRQGLEVRKDDDADT